MTEDKKMPKKRKRLPLKEIVLNMPKLQSEQYHYLIENLKGRFRK